MMKQIITITLMSLTLAACSDDTDKTKASTASTSPIAQQLPDNTSLRDGKSLHDVNCISCHDVAMYTRAARTVQNFDQLTQQVMQCDANLSKHLSDSELKQVVSYLNDNFYHFAAK